jgi:hypothetical protein
MLTYKLQKTAIVSAVHIYVLRKYQCKRTKHFIMGSNITGTVYRNYRTAAKLCTVKTHLEIYNFKA